MINKIIKNKLILKLFYMKIELKIKKYKLLIMKIISNN